MPIAAVLSESSVRTAGRDDLAAVGLRARLRSATSDAHARLDEQIRALDLRGLPDYRRFLEASAAALLPLEESLIEAGVSRISPDWALRSRRPRPDLRGAQSKRPTSVSENDASTYCMRAVGRA